MCGINGFNWQDEGLIKKMNQRISHRGFDDSGFFLTQNVSLGHQRLSILDLSEKGHQPMSFKNLTIIYNGELYNYQEIRDELKKSGHQFESDTDTEVILKSYYAWGTKCLDKFNGIFVLAILDQKKQELFLARDQIGVKPLFYYLKDKTFIFSSEIKAILEHKIDKTILPERISFVYKMSCLPGELTMFKYIHQLPAAHYVVFKNNFLVKKCYWQLTDFTDINNKDEIATKIREILNDSVKKQMISDVPLGVFLSGGIDSSVITMLASRHSHQPVKTFSVGFDVEQESEKFNADFYLARQTAQYFKTDHQELFLKKGQALQYMDFLADNLEMPNNMTTSIPSFWLSKWAKKQVSVVLGGDGGDELFGGYQRYQLSLIISNWLRIPSLLRKVAPYKLIEVIAKKRDLISRLRTEDELKRYLSFKCHRDEDAPAIFKEIYKPELVDEYLAENFFRKPLPTKDFEKYFMLVDLQTWLVDHSLIRSDKVTMNFALEERVPMLDRRLVELSVKIPTKYKLDSRNTKKIFKETFKNDLPEFLFNQPKRGWLAPAAKWLRFEMKEFAYDVLSDNFVPESKNYFDLKLARDLLDKHIKGERYNLHLLWILITWQLWYKKNILR